MGKNYLQHWMPLSPWRACFHYLSFIYARLFYIRCVYVCYVFGMIKIFAGFFGKWYLYLFIASNHHTHDSRLVIHNTLQTGNPLYGANTHNIYR